MTIRNAILGLLSWKPCSGYDLKKMFASSASLYWSGNNNQIYTTLLQLQKQGLVTSTTQTQPSLPAKKVYTLTPQGAAELREWVLSMPQPPELHHLFLVQLAWADQLTPAELDALLQAYAAEVHLQALMQREEARRREAAPSRTPREAYLGHMIMENIVSFYENELRWVEQVRAGLNQFEGTAK
jgi:PadR family transcriptional regulator AphA